MNVSIVGTGYVGLTLAATLATVGHKVYCIDIDESKINTIKSGKSFFYEPGLDYFVKTGIESGNLNPTTKYEEAIPDSEIAIICVGTPTTDNGDVDIRYVHQATNQIAALMKDGLIIVQKSTVPVGTGRTMEQILEKSNKKFSVVSCPEFLAEGTAVIDTLEVDRFVVGGDDESAKQTVIQLFKSIDDYAKSVDFSKFDEFASIYSSSNYQKRKTDFKDKVISIGLESAELIKVTANAFLATKISFANSISRLCDISKANVIEVLDGIGRDERIGRSFLYAGLGWGGGCFPKDTAGLLNYAKKNNFDFPVLQGAIKTNDDQIEYTFQKVKSILKNEFTGKTISILGLSFKPGTSDVRMSPAIRLIKKLVDFDCTIKAYDPRAVEEAKKELIYPNVIFSDSIEECTKSSDLLILATEWPEFVNYDYSSLLPSLSNAVIFDARNRLNRKTLESLGYQYFSLGK